MSPRYQSGLLQPPSRLSIVGPSRRIIMPMGSQLSTTLTAAVEQHGGQARGTPIHQSPQIIVCNNNISSSKTRFSHLQCLDSNLIAALYKDASSSPFGSQGL
ncbi:hypothetical protein DPMN_185168 [Dreissena polymorpha]|uniref:Uncharacterized protein n=1 Tax=Dreissena polymorpha TaxID=45954 RepID=A0A9D4I719_DREPO|nr:hypothetical protein DPMN_185168 [Dreissena polymorpha]